MAACKAKKADGSPCRAPALKGGKFCHVHSRPEAAREAGRKGGQAGKRQALPRAAFSLKSPQDVAAMLERVTNLMLRGELDRALASTAGFLAQGLLKSFEAGLIEERLATLEAKLGVTK